MRTFLIAVSLIVGVPSLAYADDQPAPAPGQIQSVPLLPHEASQPADATWPSRPQEADPRTTYVVPKQILYQGGEIPSFAHLETRPDIAYVATGISIFASAYATSLVYGLTTCGAQTQCRAGSAWLYLPLAGPFVTSAKAPTTGGQALAGFDGGVQVLGATLAIVGFIVPRKYVTWQNKSVSLAVNPGLGSMPSSSLPVIADAKPAIGAGLSITLTQL